MDTIQAYYTIYQSFSYVMSLHNYIWHFENYFKECCLKLSIVQFPTFFQSVLLWNKYLLTTSLLIKPRTASFIESISIKIEFDYTVLHMQWTHFFILTCSLDRSPSNSNLNSFVTLQSFLLRYVTLFQVNWLRNGKSSKFEVQNKNVRRRCILLFSQVNI